MERALRAYLRRVFRNRALARDAVSLIRSRSESCADKLLKARFSWFDNFGRGGEEIRNCGSNGRRGSSLFGRGGGSLTICSIESKDGLGGGGLVVVGRRSSGEECLDGWVRAGGGEVKGGGVDFGDTKSLLGEIPGESGGEEFGVDGGAV
ncbi:hypothetical protein Tco_0620396 [Tanacetum coccineum]